MGGGHVSDSVRRVSVQIDTLVDMLIGTDRGGTVIDVTLPSGVEVAELIPAIVDLAVGADGVDAESPTAWKLARVGGTVLDASRTLTENGIREGELLMLTGAASAPVTRAEAPPGLEPAAGRWHGARTALALWCPIAGTAAVVWTGLMRDDIGRTVPAAMLTVGAVAAVLPYRHRRDPLTATASALIVVMLAAVLGLLVVPDGPGPPNLMLAAAAAAAAAMVMARLTGVDIVGLTAVATGAAAVAISLIPAVLWPVPTVVIGVLTASLSMAVLAVAPRLSIALAGLTPAPDGGPDAPGSLFDDAPAAPRLVRGNAILTGILTGAAVTAVIGTTLIALGGVLVGQAAREPGSGPGGPWWTGPLFTALLAAALVLRARSHADALRRGVLVGCGVGCATMAFTAVVIEHPGQASAWGALAVAIGLVAAGGRPSAPVSPLIRRAADVAECVVLAALAPLACWVAGVYGLVRGLALW